MLTDEQILEHFNMPGLNLEATLDQHDLGLLLTGIRSLLAAHSAGTQAIDPRDVLADTGHYEADRLIGRLTSADPDFDDCTDAAILIRQLVTANQCVHAKGIIGDEGGTPCCPVTMTPDAQPGTDAAGRGVQKLLKDFVLFMETAPSLSTAVWKAVRRDLYERARAEIERIDRAAKGKR
jgi:hypothetical protein